MQKRDTPVGCSDLFPKVETYIILCDTGFRPGRRATFVSAKVAKTMLAVAWPFGSPARFANPGGAQTLCAQTMRTFSLGLAARLGHTTRPGEMAGTLPPLIMGNQLAALRQGPLIFLSVNLDGQAAGVDHGETIARMKILGPL